MQIDAEEMVSFWPRGLHITDRSEHVVEEREHIGRGCHPHKSNMGAVCARDIREPIELTIITIFVVVVVVVVAGIRMGVRR